MGSQVQCPTSRLILESRQLEGHRIQVSLARAHTFLYVYSYFPSPAT